MASSGHQGVSIFGLSRDTATMALAILVGLAGIGTHASQAASFHVVHSFAGGSDGAYPDAGLTMDVAGNFYGTTRGTTSGSGWNGTVYMLSPSGSGWTVTTLYEFAGGTDGDQPIGRVLIGPDGSLYGTTFRGGGSGCGGFGCGTVFKLSNSGGHWTEAVLYRFTGGTDGAEPSDDLARDSAGAIYGTASSGGVLHSCGGPGCGVVWKLTPSGSGWTEAALYQFHNTDGAVPTGGVILDHSGSLYGVTFLGGTNNFGTVFQLTPSGSGCTQKVLYNFNNGTDGKYPNTGLVLDTSGSLYGTTSMGGTGLGGTVFELTPSGSDWTFSTLDSLSGGDGPSHGSLTLDAGGNLYGTTAQDGSQRWGSAFKLTPSHDGWTYTSLYDFTGGDDGLQPESNLTFDMKGDLFGTTLGGGTNGYGVVFEISGVGPCPSKFYAVTPCRLVDTRHSPHKDVYEPGDIAPPGYPRGSYASAEARSYDLTLSSDCPGLPSGVVAWWLLFQFTTQGSSGIPSFLVAWPYVLAGGVGGQTVPANESTMLGYADRWTANSAIIPAGNDANGSINVFVQNAGDVIVEVNGYFK